MAEISEWTVWQLVQMSLAFVPCLGILTMDNITYTKPELGGELLLIVLAFLFIATSRSASLSIGRLFLIDVVGVLRGFPDCRR
jgi:hypothetical protein